MSTEPLECTPAADIARSIEARLKAFPRGPDMMVSLFRMFVSLVPRA